MVPPRCQTGFDPRSSMAAIKPRAMPLIARQYAVVLGLQHSGSSSSIRPRRTPDELSHLTQTRWCLPASESRQRDWLFHSSSQPTTEVEYERIVSWEGLAVTHFVVVQRRSPRRIICMK